MRAPLENTNWVKVVFTVVLCTAFFFVQRHYWPDLYWRGPPALFLIIGGVYALTIGKTLWWRFRDGGYRVQVGGVSGSINGPPILVSDPSVGKGFKWALYGLGAVPPFKGKLGLLVVPYNQMYVSQGFHSGLTMTQRWNVFTLPAVVQKLLGEIPDEFNLDVIHFGRYSQEFIDRSGVGELSKDDQLSAKDSLIRDLDETNKNKFEHLEQTQNLFTKMGGKRSWFQKVLEGLKKKEETEE